MSVNAYDPTTDSLILLAAGTKKTNTVLTVTTDISRLYGETVTVTDGKETLTDDLSQTGRVTFELANLGTYTITCDIYSTSVNNEDYGSGLSAIVGPPIVSWSEGTDEQIVKLITAADLGDIDLYEDAGWRVGDERTIHLSAMEAMSPLDDTHAAQDTVWVLMHKGLYKKTSDNTDVNFVVGMKLPLDIGGKMHSSIGGSQINWSNCNRRTWCNSTFKNAIPSDIRSIFKQFKTITPSFTTRGTPPTGQSLETTNDYFAYFDGKEIEGELFNDGNYYSPSMESNLTQLDWFKTSANRAWTSYTTSQNGTIDANTAAYYNTRCPFGSNSDYFVHIVHSGKYAAWISQTNKSAIWCFGCI